MANLAIKGHKTRGKEVIEILEMLGGRTMYTYNGDDDMAIYFIDGLYIMAYRCEDVICKGYTIFTLEEFLEKFPYKVGDKVQRSGATSCGSIYVIEYMKWKDNQVEYVICDLYWKNCKCTVMSKDLRPYKEETMEEIKVDIPKGYEFAGVDDDKQQVMFTKIQPQYPKTYKECCMIIGFSSNTLKWDNPFCINRDTHPYIKNLDNLIESFYKLLICRDAYWKIAGEQIGLGKPWEPDWNDLSTNHEFIKINKGCFTYSSRVLVFPTKEMRDAFYENFKDLIEKCKKLL